MIKCKWRKKKSHARFTVKLTKENNQKFNNRFLQPWSCMLMTPHQVRYIRYDFKNWRVSSDIRPERAFQNTIPHPTTTTTNLRSSYVTHWQTTTAKNYFRTSEKKPVKIQRQIILSNIHLSPPSFLSFILFVPLSRFFLPHFFTIPFSLQQE
jgi:hypothetical protein